MNMNVLNEVSGVSVDLISPHPENRKFSQKGEVWESFVASIRSRGVLVPLMVRPVGEGFEILMGERRWTAAREAGLSEVPVMVREVGDEEALALILVENLQRAGLSPMEEARGLRVLMVKAGMSVEAASEALSMAREWVELRQGLLDLPEEAQGYVERGGVELEVMQMVLDLPVDCREEALQLVLHPELQEQPLDAVQSRRVIERKIVEPARAKREWAEREGVLRTAWTLRLRDCDRGELELEPVKVVVAEWAAELPNGGRQAALDLVYEVDLTGDAPDDCRWVHLAQRHGLPVEVFCKPGAMGEVEALAGSIALVNAELILSGEQALEESKSEEWAWLSQARKSVPGVRLDPDAREDEEELSNEDSRTSSTIEQGAELRGWVNLGKVRALRKLVSDSVEGVGGDGDPPDWLPEEVYEAAMGAPLSAMTLLSWVEDLPGEDAAGDSN